MALSSQRKHALDTLCRSFRIRLIEMLHAAGSGHPGGSLSACEILATLYFEKANVDAENQHDPARDRIILSKGHAAPMLYIALAEKGFFPKEELFSLRRFGTRLQGHPCMKHTPGVELTSGPLGMGLSAGVGMALALRMDHNPATVYVVLGDGELNEGTVWEACMSAAKFQTDHLVAIVDRNHVQLDGPSDEIMPLFDVDAKFRAFGFSVFHCDGHDVAALAESIDAAKAAKGPSVIIAETVKGKGISFMEGKNIWHGKPVDDAIRAAALGELEGGCDE